MYYVVGTPTATTLELSATSGGTAITTTAAGLASITQVQGAPYSLTSLGGTAQIAGSDNVFTIFTDLTAAQQQHITFLSDGGTGGAAGVNRLFDATPGKAGAVDTSFLTNAPNGSISKIKEQAGRLYLSGANSSVTDGFSYDPSTLPIIGHVNLAAADYSVPTSALFPQVVNYLDTPPETYTINNNPFALIEGLLSNSGVSAPDFWFLPNFGPSSALNPIKMTRMMNASPLGSYMISMLNYQPDGNGNPTNLSVALSSPCLQGSPSGDGQMNTTSVSVPPGQECVSGSSCPYNPFLIALDVFPELPNCSGTPVRTILNGLTGMQNPTASSLMKIIQTSGSQLGIFLKD
jgi:hypothetical protein